MSQQFPNTGRDVLDNMAKRIVQLEREVKALRGNRLVSIDTLDTASYPSPVQGQLAVERANNFLTWYSNAKWRTLGLFQIKVFSDTTVLTAINGAVIMMIPDDLNGRSLQAVAAFVTTVSSSGLPTVQIRNVTSAVNMLSTTLTIDANEFTSYTAATAAVINPANSLVSTGNLIAIDVTTAGTGAKGLGVNLGFW